MTGITPGSDRWRELIEMGRDAVARAEESISERNWRLGDAALEIAPIGDGRVNNGALAALETYANEIGVTAESLRSYRALAAQWPHDTRVSCAGWKVHQILAREDRQHLVHAGMTVTEAHRAADQSTIGRTGPRSSPEQRARQTLDNLADPETRAYLEKMARTPLDDLNLQAIAAGGRVPAPRQRERDALDMIGDVLSDEQRRTRLLDDVEAAVNAYVELGPCGDDGPWAARVQALSLALLNTVTDRVSR